MSTAYCAAPSLPTCRCSTRQSFSSSSITSLGWNNVRHTCLRDIHFGANRYLLQHHSHLHLIGHVGIVEFVRVAQAFMRDELDIFAAKRVAFARCEVPERHFERAADPRF